MNEELRDAFISLHSQPLLSRFRDDLVRMYPYLRFDHVPQRGGLDLDEVAKSKYFFS